MRTHGKGAEHFGQGIREILVACVHLEVNLSKIRSSIHGNLHKADNSSSSSTGARCLLPFAAFRLSHNIFPVVPHRWPTYHLCSSYNTTTHPINLLFLRKIKSSCEELYCERNLLSRRLSRVFEKNLILGYCSGND